MGFIKAAVSAVGSTLSDSFKEAIRCEDMGNDTLMVKKTTPSGVITNKSTVIVAPGQCAIIYDNGRVLDATAEEGIYTFDTSSSPTFFAGQFKDTFKEMWTRFTYNGASSKQQAVFYFNLKEIMNNKFGTSSPIPYQDWSHPIPNQMTNTVGPLSVHIRCYGQYTFRIIDPGLLMNKLAGTADVYKKSDLEEQIRAEVIGVFQNVVNELGTEKYKVPVLEMPSQTDEIKELMDEKVFDQKVRERGLQIESFVIESVQLDEESKDKINNYELASNSFMQQGTLVGSYAEAVKDAANNEGGAVNGFMGVGMMNMASGGVMGGAVQSPFQQQQGNSIKDMSNEQKPEPPKGKPNAEMHTWACVDCGNENPEGSKFCSNCGKARPKPAMKACSKCGKDNPETAKFCGDCGEAL